MTEVEFPGLGISVNVPNVAFSIGSYKVYWYAIIIVAAIILCIALAVMQSKKNNFPQTLVYDFILVTIPCGFVGARIYYVICKWSYFSQDLKRIFYVHQGGLAIYGGILGGMLGLYIMCKIRKISFTAYMDYIIVYVPLAQAIGRWGNFFNQEAFGTTTSLPWGMTSDKITAYLETYCPTLDATSPVHPTFLYESICNLILFFILMWVRKKSKYAFETTSVYFVCYGVIRFFIESLRTDSLYIPGTAIRISQALSLVLALCGLFYIAYLHTKRIYRRKFPKRLYEFEESLVTEK